MADTLPEAKAQWVGTWKNRKGSVLRIVDIVSTQTGSADNTEHYLVSGTYQTAKGAVPSKIMFPVSGFVTRDQIVFSVSFRFPTASPPVSSMTSWTGQILPDDADSSKEVLKTLWNLTRDIEEGKPEEERGWALAIAGADTFERINKTP